MINGMTVLGLITARGGSKGLPGKNIRSVGGRPLIDFTIVAAKAAHSIDRLVLSTDDDEIARVALACGCEVPFRRPAHLSTDTAASIDVALHALTELPSYDIVVLLQPTSPARSTDDIDAACWRLAQSGAPSCVSVCLADQSPYWMYRLDDGQHLYPLLEAPADVQRRQDLPPVYVLNGAIYVARSSWLRKHRRFVGDGTVAHLMPAARSIDIDTHEDIERFARSLCETTR
jgi:N-acylneuraminate cytidylyltransferase